MSKFHKPDLKDVVLEHPQFTPNTAYEISFNFFILCLEHFGGNALLMLR